MEGCYESSHCRRRARRYERAKSIRISRNGETNGSAIDEETIALIQERCKRVKVIVFTDPWLSELVFSCHSRARTWREASAASNVKSRQKKTIIGSWGGDTQGLHILFSGAQSVHEISTDRACGRFLINTDGLRVYQVDPFSNGHQMTGCLKVAAEWGRSRILEEDTFYLGYYREKENNWEREAALVARLS